MEQEEEGEGEGEPEIGGFEEGGLRFYSLGFPSSKQVSLYQFPKLQARLRSDEHPQGSSYRGAIIIVLSLYQSSVLGWWKRSFFHGWW